MSKDLMQLITDRKGLEEEINNLLSKVAILGDAYMRLTGYPITKDVPEYVEDTHDYDSQNNAELVYNSNGVSVPREDGAVRVKDWDDAIDAALQSDDATTKRWGETRQRWMFIQDVLKMPDITAEQKRNVGWNTFNAMIQNGFLGPKNTAGWSWPAYPVVQRGDGSFGLSGEALADTFAVIGDRTDLNGKVLAPGWWAKNMATLAKNSLEHYKRTSSGKVPYDPSYYGKS